MRERTVPDPLQDGSTNAPLTFLQQLQRLNSRQVFICCKRPQR